MTKLYDPKTDPKEIEAIIAYLESKPEQDKNDFERYSIKLVREGRLDEFLNSKPVINRTPTFTERTIYAISKPLEEHYTYQKQLNSQWLELFQLDPTQINLVLALLVTFLFFKNSFNKKKLNGTNSENLNYTCRRTVKHITKKKFKHIPKKKIKHVSRRKLKKRKN